MTEQEILEIARGFPQNKALNLFDFAKAIAAKEREACINLYSPDDTATDWADKIRARNPITHKEAP